MTTSDPDISSRLPMDELVSLILGGRSELFEEVIRRYQTEVHRVIAMLLADRAASEELVQQVFVQAYFSLGQFRAGSDFGPWIRTIARNAAREELRRRTRYDRRLRDYAEMLQQQMAGQDRADAEQRSRAEALQRCLGCLSPREADAVRLRYREGKSFDEMADILGGTNGSMRNLLCQARARLRECLQNQRNEP